MSITITDVYMFELFQADAKTMTPDEVATAFYKNWQEVHELKENANNLEGIRHLKNRRIAELEAQVSRLKNDLQDCWEAKAQIEERMMGGAM